MKKLLAIALTLLLSACNSTPYQEDVDNSDKLFSEDYPVGGYSSEKSTLIPNQYIVMFRGNPFTPSETADDYAMIRATAICLEQTMPFIEVLEYNLTYIHVPILNNKPVVRYRITCLDTDKGNVLAKDAVEVYKRLTSMYAMTLMPKHNRMN